MRSLVFISLLFLGTIPGFAQEVPPGFLGVHTNHMPSWPIQVPAGLYRTLSSTEAKGGNQWWQIQTDATTFNFGLIDDAMQATAAQGIEVTYTPVGVPSFVVGRDINNLPIGWTTDGSQRRDCACAPDYSPDHCYPPGDINPDGSGTDAAWVSYVTALATHVHTRHVEDPTGYSDIAYWENGNEWTANPRQFCGSFAQIGRMLQDEKCVVAGTGPGCTRTAINASAKMMTIALQGAGVPVDRAYLATIPNIPQGATPAQLADIVNFHCYENLATPENQISHGMLTLQYAESNPDLRGKPVFCTEGGWGGLIAPDTWTHGTDFLSRFLLGLASSGVQRFILFGYDFYSQTDGPGSLAQLADTVPDHGCTLLTPHGFLCPTGVAWTRIAAWLKDVNFAGPCTSTASGAGHIWTCSHTTAGEGYSSGQFAWFDVLDQIALYPAPSNFTRQEDMSGAITMLVKGGSIPLSNSPVLLMDDGSRVQPPTDLSSTVH